MQTATRRPARRPARRPRRRIGRLVAMLAIGVAAGVLIGRGDHAPQAQPVRPVAVAPSPRAAVAPAWRVYEGATRCVATGATVACDNGYTGPLR